MGTGARVFIQSHYTCQEILGGKLLRVVDEYGFMFMTMVPVGTDISYHYCNNPIDMHEMMKMVETEAYDSYGVSFEY